MKKPLLLSVIIHALLIASFAVSFNLPGCGGGSGDSETEGKKEGNKEAISERETKFQEGEQEEATVSIDILSREEADRIIREAKCDKWFGGIGISHNYFNVVIDCPTWYPAYQAGIRSGDIIVSDINDIRGDIGQTIKVTVNRRGLVLTFTLERGKICYEEKEQ